MEDDTASDIDMTEDDYYESYYGSPQQNYPPLAFFPEIVNRVTNSDEYTIQLMHLFLFSDSDEDNTARRNILRFRGFERSRKIHIDSRKFYLETLPLSSIRKMCFILHINIAGHFKSELIYKMLKICSGSFEDALEEWDDWHELENAQTADASIIEDADVFEEFTELYYKRRACQNAKRIAIRELKRYPARFRREFDNLWMGDDSFSTVYERISNLFCRACSDCALFTKQQKIYPVCSSDIYNEWKVIINELLYVAAYAHLLKNGTLITLTEAVECFQCYPVIRINETAMVFCWLKLFEEVGHIAERAAFNGNYILPYRIFMIMVDFMKRSSEIIHTKSHNFEKKMRAFKYSLSRVLEVLFNAKLRKKVVYPPPSQVSM